MNVFKTNVVIAAKNNSYALFYPLLFTFSHIEPVLQVITLLDMVPVIVPLFHVKMPSSHVTGARKLLPLQIYPLWMVLLLSQFMIVLLTVAFHSPTSLSPVSPSSTNLIKKGYLVIAGGHQIFLIFHFHSGRFYTLTYQLLL